jgi:hypothetical protein
VYKENPCYEKRRKVSIIGESIFLLGRSVPTQKYCVADSFVFDLSSFSYHARVCSKQKLTDKRTSTRHNFSKHTRTTKKGQPKRQFVAFIIIDNTTCVVLVVGRKTKKTKEKNSSLCFFRVLAPDVMRAGRFGVFLMTHT